MPSSSEFSKAVTLEKKHALLIFTQPLMKTSLQSSMYQYVCPDKTIWELTSNMIYKQFDFTECCNSTIFFGRRNIPSVLSLIVTFMQLNIKYKNIFREKA